MFFPLHLGPGPHPHDLEDELHRGRGPDAPMDEELPDDPTGAGAVLHSITMIEKLQRKAFGVIFHEQGLHPAQGVCLKTISQNEGLSQRELADMLRIERATASVMLQKMERAGIIDRKADASDQRISRIYLTEKGRLANQLTDDACRAFISGILDNISEEDKEMLRTALKSIEQNTHNFIEQHEKYQHENQGR